MRKRENWLKQRFRAGVLQFTLLSFALLATAALAGTAGVVPINFTTSQGECSLREGQFDCDLGDLAVGGKAIVTLVLQAETAGRILNEVSVTGNEHDPDPNQNFDSHTTTTVEAGTDLSIVKTDSGDPVVIGQQMIYTIRVANNGPSTGTGVSIVDVLPAGFEFNWATSSQGYCWDPRATVWCSLGDLGAGQVATIEFFVVPTEAGLFENCATVSGQEWDPIGSNNIGCTTTTVHDRAATGVINLTVGAPASYPRSG